MVPAEQLMARGLDEARGLAQLGSSPFSASKRALRRDSIRHIRETLDENIREFGG